MKQFAIFGLLGLALMSFDGFVAAQDAHAAKKGMCTGGAELNIEKNRAVCYKITKTKTRQYKPYKPCLPPGKYKKGDEVPNGSKRGRDRCSVGTAIVGPALPCAPGQKLEIRKGKTDRCYVTKTKNTKKYFDLKLTN